MGVDEGAGTVPGVLKEELANWWPRVQAQFQTPAHAARLTTDLAVHVDGVTVLALLFDTERPPYLVRNPAYGQRGGGPVALEVPWREGTSVRTATHEDLVRILSPLQRLPKVAWYRRR